MNTTNTSLFKAMNESETKALTTIVKETLATATHHEKHFTAAELWNIQRQKRSAVTRNHFA